VYSLPLRRSLRRPRGAFLLQMVRHRDYLPVKKFDAPVYSDKSQTFARKVLGKVLRSSYFFFSYMLLLKSCSYLLALGILRFPRIEITVHDFASSDTTIHNRPTADIFIPISHASHSSILSLTPISKPSHCTASVSSETVKHVVLQSLQSSRR
jgi:hypothetical protein